MTAGSVPALIRRYCLVLAAIGVPVLLLVAGLAVARFNYERSIRLETFARDVADLQRSVDAFLGPVVDHVRQLRQAAEDQLSGQLSLVPSPLRAHLAENPDGTGLILRGIAGTPREDMAGNLYGHVDLLTARTEDLREIDMALGLFGPMRLGQLTAQQLHASYYISGRDDFFVVFPYSRERTFSSKPVNRLVDDTPCRRRRHRPAVCRGYGNVDACRLRCESQWLDCWLCRRCHCRREGRGRGGNDRPA